MEAAERATVAAYEVGVPETEIAKALGVNRMTVRRWLGKL
jgi:predicted regulator of amino acid metabolism with ACT domain